MITVDHRGRLGNNMFQYAVVRSVAEKIGCNFHITPSTWKGKSLFNCDLGVADGSIERTFTELDGGKFNPLVFDVLDNTHLEGFWQSEKYFDREKVKEWFKPTVPSAVRQFQLEFPKHKYCYINVRGTDQHIPHLTLPEDYYIEARSTMLEFNQDLGFVVITDDINLAKDYFPDYPVFSNDRDTDFCLLNQATFMIGAISTFAWWAGYLNDCNVVVMPKRFYHYNIPDMGWGPRDIHTHKFIWI
jgi:hypothetical protein